jgi:hypothetical protein
MTFPNNSSKIAENTFGYVTTENDVFLKGYSDKNDRKIGIVKTTPQASLEYFEKRFDQLADKVKELSTAIEEAVNKGTFLMKLIHIKESLNEYNGLGNFVVLETSLDDMIAELNGSVAINRIKNLEIKQALLAEAKSILDQQNEADPITILAFSDQMKEIKQKWIKTGAVVVDMQRDIENSFEEYYQTFFENRKYVIKEKSKQAKERTNYYRSIIMRAEEIRNSDDFDEIFAEFRELQQYWKTGGKVPHRKATELWDKFKQINDYFFTRYKNFKLIKGENPELSAQEIKDKYQNAYLEEAEKLVNFDVDDNDKTERAKELLVEWKKLGNVFRQLENETGEKFRTACDKIFEFSYLMRVVRRKYTDIEQKPQEDQLRIKTSFMRELIRRDESEILIGEANFTKVQANEPIMTRETRQLSTNLQIQKRKVVIKKAILKTMEDTLRSLKPARRY